MVKLSLSVYFVACLINHQLTVSVDSLFESGNETIHKKAPFKIINVSTNKINLMGIAIL